MKKLLFSVIILSAACISSCYYDKEDILYPLTATCDTTTITYSQSVVPVITSSCLGCHGGTNASAGIRLDNHAGVKAMAVNGKLLLSITHSPGASPMPKNGAKLSECNITKIRKWVEDGAPQN